MLIAWADAMLHQKIVRGKDFQGKTMATERALLSSFGATGNAEKGFSGARKAYIWPGMIFSIGTSQTQ